MRTFGGELGGRTGEGGGEGGREGGQEGVGNEEKSRSERSGRVMARTSTW